MNRNIQHISRDSLSAPQSPLIPATPGVHKTFPHFLEFAEPASSFEPLPGSDPLVDLYNKVLAFVSRDCAPLLDAADRRLRGSMLVTVVWEELQTRLIAELGHVIFAAGRPESFHSVSAALWHDDIADGDRRTTSRPRPFSLASRPSARLRSSSSISAAARASSPSSSAGRCPSTSSSASRRSRPAWRTFLMRKPASVSSSILICFGQLMSRRCSSWRVIALPARRDRGDAPSHVAMLAAGRHPRRAYAPLLALYAAGASAFVWRGMI